MVWVKIDDGFPDHPKLAKAGPLGLALQVAALCYCARNLTDGFIPKSVAGRLLDFSGLAMNMWDSGEGFGGGDDAGFAAIADMLVEAKIWSEVDGGYQIHDYLDYQPSAETVKNARRKTADRVKKWHSRQQVEDANGDTNAVTNAATNAAPEPEPEPKESKAPPLAPPQGATTNGASLNDDQSRDRNRATRLAPDWQPTADDFAFAEREGFDRQRAIAVAAGFRDYWIAKPGNAGRKLDWPATWRNWVRRERGQPNPSQRPRPLGTVAAVRALLAEDDDQNPLHRPRP